MVRAGFFLDCIREAGIDFFTGVPDSFLRPLCDTIMEEYGISNQHRIASNEGNCLALAAGHYLSTGKPACVYLQNSGIGNLYNPYCSLMHRDVYRIPSLLVIGWRGEPGKPDEPQHRFQGRVTTQVLESMEIPFFILGCDIGECDFHTNFRLLCQHIRCGDTAAVLVQKNAFSPQEKRIYHNSYSFVREMAITCITKHFKGKNNVFLVSSTGKISRELFEIRERGHENHSRDFLTVGSMGHTSSIALQIALEHPERQIVCLDGDGAALMHMGSMALIGSAAPKNLLHVVLDNGAHETVGGMPTVSAGVDFGMIAKACGYRGIWEVCGELELEHTLHEIQKRPEQLTFLRVKTALGSRGDLGRPTGTPVQGKQEFMKALQEGEQAK